VPDRQRQDEFIRALIFSLIINLLFVFALLTQRYVEPSPTLQPFFVSIAEGRRALPSQPHAIPGPTVMPALTKTKKTLKAPSTIRPQGASVDPVPPAQVGDEEAAVSPLTAAERAGTETAQPSLPTAGESATAIISKEITDGLSILRDKMPVAHYTAPEYLGGEKPPYPKRAERNGWEGTVLLSLTINASGEVEKVEIVKTSGYELLDHQARTSVSAWRFKPARRNGVAIAVTVQQPIIFRPAPPENDQ
jgi:protein TonB